VDSINKQVLLKFPGESHIFYSADSIPTSEQSGGDDPMPDYPVEYLNEINCSGLSLAKLELKCGCPIMILRNINPRNGICNGSRGILTRISSRILEVQLLTGGHIGKKVLIPRISNVPTDEQVDFKFIRRQFPIKVCFAMTINKSQGQTVRYVGLDLRRPVFSHGQYDVGISRVASVWNIKAIWE
jgi:ATP-dependent exoDNAse (exonuclease V) alpha subunit